jgi:hypothetical protein
VSALAVVLTILGPPIGLYVLARLVGLGACLACGRSCPPWNAYCWTHSPDNPEGLR